MNIMKRLLTFIVFFAITAVLTVSGQTINADKNLSKLVWTGKKVSGSHTGTINLKEGTFNVEKNRIVSGKFLIDMTTIVDTDLEGSWKEKLEGHLRSEDFFSVEKFSTATLIVESSTEFMSGKAEVSGKLTIKGMTHPVKFAVVQADGKYKALVTVDRTLYDIRYGSGKFFSNLGDNMIDDMFTLDVTIVPAK